MAGAAMKAVEWSDSDFFWTTFEDQLFDKQRWRDVRREVKQLVRLMGVKPGAKILDLACGPGRHLLGLAGQGFMMTGVDRTMHYLEQVGRRAREDGVDVELVRSDMRSFCRDKEFDAVIHMYNSFGYFANKADDIKVISNVYRSLKHGGVFIMDVTGKEVLARRFVDCWTLRESGAKLSVYERICEDWTWREMRWVVSKDGRKYEYTAGHRVYCAAEMKHELAAAGFKSVNVYGDLDGAAYDHNARQMVVIGRK